MSEAIDVRALRERIGWNQDELGQYVGRDRSSVSHMENGRPINGAVRRLLEMLIEAANNGTAEALRPMKPQTAEAVE